MKIQNKNLSNVDLHFDKSEIHILGPELELWQCNVFFNTRSRDVIFAGLVMRNGRFEVAGPFVNFHFENVHFDGVEFHGEFCGCDFGDWDSIEKSSINNCDFSEAKLDGCRFLNCDFRVQNVE